MRYVIGILALLCAMAGPSPAAAPSRAADPEEQSRAAEANLDALLKDRKVLMQTTTTIDAPDKVAPRVTDSGTGLRVEAKKDNRGIQVDALLPAGSAGDLLVVRCISCVLVPLTGYSDADRKWYKDHSLLVPDFWGNDGYDRRVRLYTDMLEPDGKDHLKASILIGVSGLERDPPTLQVDVLVLGKKGTGPGTRPEWMTPVNPDAPVPASIVESHVWKTADIIFPAGTKVVKFHLDDTFTYSYNRECWMSMRLAGRAAGWGTFVYPDAFTKLSGFKNAPLYFGDPGIGAAPDLPVPDGFVWHDHEVKSSELWELEITCDRAKTKSYFGHGFDGELVVDSPQNVKSSYLKGDTRTPITLEIGQTKKLKFSVAPK